MSSMLPAPAIMPATSAGTFTRAFPPPGLSILTCPATRSCKAARSASCSTGARPAHDTRLGSSNSAVKPWHTRIYRCPSWLRIWSLEKTDSPAAPGHLGFTTCGSRHDYRWIQAQRDPA